ncbi:MAG TPA: PDZ domain-containing protein [Terriglobales bacterium]|jgi:tricorn protease|nr:PDZ domain-containing protein [Terriglobales bacterium]
MISIRSFFAFIVIGLVIGCACLTAAQEAQEGRLLRFPDIYKDKIAFMYGGDLWLASSSGGTARRITSHPGRELFPKFSPDGRWLAFTGQYDGNFNVYVMPSEGGQPKQLTFYQGSAQPLSDRMGVLNQVIGWTPDGKSIVFLSRRDASNGWIKRPYTVSVEGGLPQPMPMDEGGLLSFSADGTKIAYNRIFRNFRQWKRYTGGLAQDITIYDIKKNVVDQVIPHTDYTDTFPMWHGNTIYFTSDRGPEHRLNLYSYDQGSKQIEQLTKFDAFDVMWPSLGPDAIIFENGGYLYTFDLQTHDLQTRQPKKLTIYVSGERDQAMKHWVNASRQLTDFDIAPDGKRVVIAARGEVFTVPAKDGSIRNLTQSPGVREQKVAWSPNGQWIAYVSDRTGEDEIYVAPQDGLAAEEQITSGHKGFMFQPAWSPDSSKIAWADKDLKLWYVDIKEKKPVEVDRAKYFEIQNYSWSPDSKWLAYDKNLETGYSVVYLYGLADHKITAVTSPLNNSYATVFDPDKRYLYFLSDRDYNEVVGSIDSEFANPKTTRVYVVTLTADEPSPFPALSDEVKVKSEEPAAAAAPESNKKNQKQQPNKKEEKPATEEKAAQTETKEPPKVFKIDLDGIQDRIVALAVPAAVIRNLDASKEAIYYSTSPIQGLSGPIPGENKAIHAYDLKERKDKVLLDGADRFALSHDGSKLLYRAEGEGEARMGIIDAKPPDAPHKVGDGVLNLAGMRAEVDPPQEWKEIFNEVWRQERDYFFEASMNGVDWQKTKDQYAQLLPYVADRYSLTYIMGEMIGELSNSHTYVGGGDFPDLHPVNLGLLGADYEADAASGMYRIKKIFSGENWDAHSRSPLTEPGVNIKEGDYLVAINGRALRAPQTPDELLVNTANEVVTLTVNSKPVADGARKVVVKPIGDEYSLRQLNMIETNRKKVDAASGGRIGYVYLPDMGDAGLNEFVKQYFPQIRKEGIIFDVRYNGGGFVDGLIFERLRRVLAAMGSARNWESGTRPSNVFYGYMACVTNHYAASDGDIFSYLFKQYKLGPLIGERTWGGVRGIRGNIPLMDGGYITRPEFSLYGLDSKWVIENRGVQPDVVVDNPPDLVLKGQDPQLEKAVEMLMEQIKANPKKLPARPPDLPTYPEGPGF